MHNNDDELFDLPTLGITACLALAAITLAGGIINQKAPMFIGSVVFLILAGVVLWFGRKEIITNLDRDTWLGMLGCGLASLIAFVLWTGEGHPIALIISLCFLAGVGGLLWIRRRFLPQSEVLEDDEEELEEKPKGLLTVQSDEHAAAMQNALDQYRREAGTTTTLSLD